MEPNTNNRCFGLNKRIFSFIHHIALLAILHSSFVAPAQGILDAYINKRKPVTYTGGGNTISNSGIEPGKKAGYLQAAAPAYKTTKADTNRIDKYASPAVYSVPSDSKEGVIGVSKDKPIDNPSDNLFKVNLEQLPAGYDKVYLNYEVFGLADHHSVARSINERLSVGGHLIKKQYGWSKQKEEINPLWLHKGANSILFTIPQGADYQYRIRNLSISIEKSDKVNSILVLDNRMLTFSRENKIYIKGFIRGDHTEARVDVSGTYLQVSNNEFEGYITLTEELKKNAFLVVKCMAKNELLGQELLFIDNIAEADGIFPLEKKAEAAAKLFRSCTSSRLDVEGASFIANDSALVKDYKISLTQLRSIDIAPMGSGMVNVTKGGRGYRFLPEGTKFDQPVSLSIAYDQKLIPTGYTEKDIRTYYFDTDAKKWKAVVKDSIDVKNNAVISKTTHFTDYINGIIQAPDSPETSAFTPTMMSDVKAADPSSEMTMISPPSASQKGDANISYPIKLPAGRRGMQPQVGLQYSNEGGNGWLGLGWNLSVPALSIDTKWGVPVFDTASETEIYSLNGEQLMYPDGYLPHRHQDAEGGTLTTQMQSRNVSGNKTFYPRKQGSFAKIERLGNTPQTYYWKVTSTDGTISWYGGKTAEDVQSGLAVLKDSDGRIVHWSLFMVEDVYGNNMKYSYETYIDGNTSSNLYMGQQLYLTRINYTGYGNDAGNYDVEFLRKTSRPDVSINARLGIKQVDFHLLEQIKVSYKNELIRSYLLTYVTGRFNKSLLKLVSERDKTGNEFYHHTFDYYDDIKQGDNDVYFSAEVEENICAELPEQVTDTDNDGVPDTEDGCVTVPGPASNDGCPDENPGGSTGTDPETGKTYCYELDFRMPLKNKRYLYTARNANYDFGCAYSTVNIGSFSINGTNYNAPANLYTTNFNSSGLINLCPSYTVTAVESNPDPVTRNLNFATDFKNWLQNQVLTQYLDANSNLTVLNNSGLYIYNGSVISSQLFSVSFESDSNFSLGTCSYNKYVIPTNAISTYNSVFLRQVIDADGDSVPITIDGSTISPTPFNLYEDFASFKAAVESIYGGIVSQQYNLTTPYELNSPYEDHADIKFYNVNAQMSTVTIGGITYNLIPCKDPNDPGVHRFSEGSTPQSNLLSTVTDSGYNIAFEATIPTGDPDCPSLLNLDYLLQGQIPSYNSSASLLGSSKTEGYNAGVAITFGIGCKAQTKNTTFGWQKNFSHENSGSFSAMIDIDGDGLEDFVFKAYNGSLYFRKHYVVRTYENGQLKIKHNFTPPLPISGINNFYKANSSSTTENFQVTFGFSRLGGFAGRDTSVSKGETNVYFTDANGDGLPDIVKNGTVFFNRIVNGIPEFIPDSKGSPNLVIKAEPKTVEVPDEYNEGEIKIPDYDVVKVWEAPYTGVIRITNDIVLSDPAQAVTVTIETRIKDLISGDGCLIYGKVLDSSLPELHETITSPMSGGGVCEHQDAGGAIGVNQGTLVFFRVHATDSGSNPRVDWDPKIEYINMTPVVDQNGLSPLVYQYSEDFFLSQKAQPAIFPGNGTATITWSDIAVNAPSDDVTFEIYQSEINTAANDNVENATTNDQLIYSKFCPAGSNTVVGPSTNDISGVISNIAISSNDTPGAGNSSTVFYFRVRSNSNVNWKAIEWKPQINCVTQQTVIGENNTPEGTVTTNDTLYAIPDVSIYKIYNKELNGYAPFNSYISHNSALWPISSSGQSLYILPSLNGLFSAGDNGTLKFIIKRNGVIVDKREIYINNGSVSFDNSNPIDLGPATNDAVEIGFYSDDSTLAEAQASLLAKFYNPLFTTTTDVIRIAAGNWTYGNSIYLNNKQVMLYHIPSPKFGPMHRQWGQFAYNPDLVENAATSAYGNLINANALVVNQDASQMQNAIGALENLGENITEQDLDDFESQYQGIYGNTPFFIMYPRREVIDNALSEKWYGTCPQNYASPLSYRAAGMDEVRDEYIDPDDYTVQEVLETGAYGITKYTKGKSKNTSKGVNLDLSPTDNAVAPSINVGASVSKSIDATSNSLTDYIDLNGDRYPDIVTTDKVQYTLRTGGLLPGVATKSSIDGTTGAQIMKSDNRSWGFAASGSFTAGSKETGNINGEGIGKPRFISFKGNNGAGISGNFSNGKSATARMWADVNGDGLADILEKDSNGIQVRLNFGNNIFQQMQVNSASWGLAEMFNSTSGSLGSGLGINKWNGSVELGLSLGGGHNNVENTLVDMNGDGIADMVHSDANGILVRINKGNGFVPENRWSDFRMNHESESAMSSKNLGLTFAWVIPIPLGFTVICLKPLAINPNGSDFTSTNRTRKSISDFDGDGFPDLISESGGNTLRVQYSNIRRTNMLKSVENPLGGRFTVDYNVMTPTYSNPSARWVLKNVVVEDGYDLENDGADTYSKAIEYENGYYDRREREFYGYEKVKTIDNIINAQGNITGVYRTAVSVFHNRSYYLNGLAKWSYVLKGADENLVYSRSVNNYNIRKLDNTGLLDTIAAPLPLTFDTGGSEGRRAAAIVLASTENYIYELGSTPLVSKVQFTYDERGRPTKYRYLGDLAVADDNYTAEITYYTDPTLASKNIYTVPKSIVVKDQYNSERRRREVVTADATGAITKIRANTDGSNWAETSMAYDQYGNLSQVTLPANDNNQQFSYQFQYDTDNHKLPVRTEDSFGYVSYTSYDYKFDKPTNSTDITNNLMLYTYDSFGRLITIQSPKEIENSVPYTISFGYYPKYSDLASAYDCVSEEDFMPVAVTSHYDAQHPGNDIQTYTFIDGLGRPVQVKKDIEMNFGDSSSPDLREAVSISGKVTYDPYGRAIRQYHPYYEDKECGVNLVVNEYESPHFSSTVYDEADRGVASTDPGGNTGTVAYSIGNDFFGHAAMKTRSETDQDDSQSIISESYTDVNGRTTSTKNVLTGTGAADLWTSFTYNSIGELMSYTDAANLSTTYKYDLLGRKIEIEHPDSGKTNYFYDRAGNLTKLQTSFLASNSPLQPQNRFIKYVYDYNRLTEIRYPDMPTGPNISNVKYSYGSTGNGTGRLSKQQDATGTQGFTYGNMGEMISNSRVVVAPNIPTRVFTTDFEYDSWNRINTITYPDGEVVSHQYNLGGNLVKISGTVEGSPYDYIQRIDYDYFEQRTYLLYGNGTDMAYDYTPALRRLKTMVARTSSQQSFLDNLYSYDKVGNITGLVNSSSPNANNTMGGGFSHNYSYDNLNRLTGASGSFTGDSSQAANNNDYLSDYTLEMAYNGTHGITSKAQQHNKNGQGVPENTYRNGYQYISNTHQVKEITDANTGAVQTYTYDVNGNIFSINDTGTGIYKRMFYDESNRLRVFFDDYKMQHYIYDASGERVLKGSAAPESIYENGMPQSGSLSFDSYTTYPSAYIVVNPNGRFSKHYYAGSQRIVSRIGDQDASMFDISPRPMAEGSGLTEDQVREAQIKDLTQIMLKADMGIPVFKDYEPEEEIEALEEEQTAQRGPTTLPMYFYHPDHLGSSTFLTDADGELYQFYLNLPFGETMAEQHSLTQDYETPYKFNGKELDTETGMYYYGARYYDPRSSIWISVDPLMEKYPNINPYVYCAQNPINFTDSTGMSVDGDGEGDDFYRNKDTNEIDWFWTTGEISGYENLGTSYNLEDGRCGDIEGDQILMHDENGIATEYHGRHLPIVTIEGTTCIPDYGSNPWMNIAATQLGVTEDLVNGDYVNSGKDVEKYMESSNLPKGNPWCGAFVNWVFQESNIKVSGVSDNPNWALNWRGFGQVLTQPAYGAVASKKRTGGGHVGFVAGITPAGQIILLSGNQGNGVTLQSFSPIELKYNYPLNYTPSYNLPVMEDIKSNKKMQ